MFERRVEMHSEEAFVGLASAEAYAESASQSTIRYRAFLNNLETFNPRSCLDVGAGTGTLATIIAQNNPGVEITALEVSEDMVIVGEQDTRKKGLQSQIKFVRGDAADETITKTLGPFDLIYSTYALHHWENPRRVIDNLMSNLDEDGVIYIFDLRRVWWLYWIPVQNGFFSSIRAAYLRSEIEEILADFPSESYEIRSEFPFMQSLIIRKL